MEPNTYKQPPRINYVYSKISSEEKGWTLLCDREFELSWKNFTTVYRRSSIYEISTMSHGFGAEEPADLWEDLALIERLARVGHNWWKKELLIQGYRPATVEEQLVDLSPIRSERRKRKYSNGILLLTFA